MKHLGTRVSYFGIDIYLEGIGTVYVVTSPVGVVMQFRAKPEEGISTWKSSRINVPIAHVDLEGVDWKETLREYNLKEK